MAKMVSANQIASFLYNKRDIDKILTNKMSHAIYLFMSKIRVTLAKIQIRVTPWPKSVAGTPYLC